MASPQPGAPAPAEGMAASGGDADGGARSALAADFAARRRVFSTAEDGALAYRLQSQEWDHTKGGNQFRAQTIQKDIPVARREQMTEAELLAMHKEQTEALASSDAELARRVVEAEEAARDEARRAAAAQADEDARLAAEVEAAAERRASDEAARREGVRRQDEELARRLHHEESIRDAAQRKLDEEVARRLSAQEEAAEGARRTAAAERDFRLAAALQAREAKVGSGARSSESEALDAAIAARIGGSPLEQQAEMRRLEELSRSAAVDSKVAATLAGLALHEHRAAGAMPAARNSTDPTSCQPWVPAEFDPDDIEEV
mmetsp:Transcript_15480/g.40060  ORF Transcript_15480/g.40060 Transcript_15480/m.40060 type:complete len:318 (+) Transcript_15480:154-1107(+)